jgi:hypothetical protein
MNVMHCIDFRQFSLGESPNPRSEQGIKFQVFDSQSQAESRTRIQTLDGFTGLSCGYKLEIELPNPASMVELTLITKAGLGMIDAFNPSGNSVGGTAMSGPQGLPETMRISGNTITRIEVIAPNNEMLLLEVCSLVPASQGTFCCCCKYPADTEVIGLVINLKTMNENLDIRTSVFADVYQGNEKLAEDIRIATGEVEEWQDHAPAPIPFNKSVVNPTGLSIELKHPGIRSNSDPHWRMNFTLEAVTKTGYRRSCLLTIQSSPIYAIDHGGQLNFEGRDRKSGRIPFLINY